MRAKDDHLTIAILFASGTLSAVAALSLIAFILVLAGGCP